MIAENIARVREQIAAAARRAGRDPQDILLMAVSKTVSPEAIREAYAAGVRLFGENRVQEFQAKSSALANLSSTGLKDHAARWHMIGHLQSNKAAKAVELFSAVDSVDSLRLAERLNAAAQSMRKKIPILIEINIGEEAAKNGLSPDDGELEELLQAATGLENLSIGGLMTVPPFTENPEQARPFFRRLREVRDSINARNLPGIAMRTLSMGMSHDFPVAIEEGSTCVRIGTAIFGGRKI